MGSAKESHKGSEGGFGGFPAVLVSENQLGEKRSKKSAEDDSDLRNADIFPGSRFVYWYAECDNK